MAVFFFIAHEKGFKFHAQAATSNRRIFFMYVLFLLLIQHHQNVEGIEREDCIPGICYFR